MAASDSTNDVPLTSLQQRAVTEEVNRQYREQDVDLSGRPLPPTGEGKNRTPAENERIAKEGYRQDITGTKEPGKMNSDPLTRYNIERLTEEYQQSHPEQPVALTALQEKAVNQEIDRRFVEAFGAKPRPNDVDDAREREKIRESITGSKEAGKMDPRLRDDVDKLTKAYTDKMVKEHDAHAAPGKAEHGEVARLLTTPGGRDGRNLPQQGRG